MKNLTAGALLLICTAYLAGQQVVWEDRTNWTWSKAVVVRSESFTRPRIESIARQFVKAAGRYKAARLVMVTTRADAFAIVSGKGYVEVTYESWLQQYRRHGPLLPAAEVLVLRDGALLRLRNSEGAIERKVLNGVDPTLLDGPGFQGEVLQITFFMIPDWLRGPSKESRRAVVQVRTSRPITVGLGERITGALMQKIRLGTVSVAIRNDDWFIENPHFPVVYRFDPQPNPPSFEEYKKTIKLTCQSPHPERGVIECNSHTPR